MELPSRDCLGPVRRLDRCAAGAADRVDALTLRRRASGLGDRVDLDEVRQVYLPTCPAARPLHARRRNSCAPPPPGFLGESPGADPVRDRDRRARWRWASPPPPGCCGSCWPAGRGHPTSRWCTTDGFLLPNEELEARGLCDRKGFPESYDRRALLRFVTDIKSGADIAYAPVYSHLSYDIVAGERIAVRRPDVLIVEGLNVLQPARIRGDGRQGAAVSDFFDFSVYVHARTGDVRRWYVERFLRLRQTAFSRPGSYFHRYAGLSDADAEQRAGQIWAEINGPNLADNILPTRDRATLVLAKAADHAVARVRLRKP